MKKILIAPLDWGLGHATRCIPIVHELLARGCEVLMAGSGSSLKLLRVEFPSLRSFELASYNPVYPKRGSMVLKMAFQLPKFLYIIKKEHEQVEKLIREQNVDIVISDNRYGCWSGYIPSILITHQSNILMPKRFGWLNRVVRTLNELAMKKFTCCWIPDYPNDDSMAGELISFGKYNAQINVEFIGSLSRLKPCLSYEKKYDVMVICSGPEPQRTLFEILMKKQLLNSNLKFVLVKGVIENFFVSEKIKNGEIVNFLDSNQLQQMICQSECVIARSGYSTLMDMKSLGKKIICVPTPGQTEQEYLASRLKEKGIAFFMDQHDFDLNKALYEARLYTGFKSPGQSYNLLSHAIAKILNE